MVAKGVGIGGDEKMTLNRYGIFPPGNESVLKLVVQVAVQPNYS